METHERRIPNFIFEDLLFRRRLERTLNAEYEKLNRLIAEHVRLLQERRALMSEVRETVQQRWDTEEGSASDLHSAAETEEDGNAD